jgi:hypothetical protein
MPNATRAFPYRETSLESIDSDGDEVIFRGSCIFRVVTNPARLAKMVGQSALRASMR